MEKELKTAEQHIIEQNQEILKFLKGSRLFSPFSEKLIAQLLAISKIQEIPKGEKILEEGEINVEVYFLLEGEIGLYTGGQHILNLRRKGDIFGERSAISKHSNLSTVIAKTPVKVFSIKSQDIGNYTNIGADEFHSFLYRLFAIIMMDKLSLTTHKAEKYEITQNKLLKEIKEHKRSEEALRESEERYRTLFERSSDAIFIIDNRTGKYINANQAAERLTGLTLSEIKTKTTKDLTPEGAEQRLEILLTFETSKELGEVKYVRADGKIRDTLLTAIQISGEQIIGIAHDVTERKQAELVLIEKEKILNETGKIAKIGGWELDTQTLSMSWTKETHQIHEVSEDYIPTLDNAYDYYHPDDRSTVETVVENALNNKESYDENVRFITAKGKQLTVRIMGKPQLKDGKVVKLSGIIQDITELKQAEEALRKSEEQYRQLFQNANEGICIVQDGKLVFFNPMTVKILGYTEADLLEMQITEFIHPNDQEMVLDRHLRRSKGEDLPSKYPFRIVWKNNSVHWIELNTVLIEWEGKAATLNFFNDTTERRQMEENLKDKQQTLSAILNASPDIIALHDTEGRFLETNESLAQILNKPKNEIIGLKLIDLYESEEAQRRKLHFDKIIQSGKSIRNEYGGDGIWFEILGFPIFNEERKVTKVASIARNITDRKQAEEALKNAYDEMENRVKKQTADYKTAKEEAEIANIAKSEFLANISHELRTPMHGILSFSKFGIDKLDKISEEKKLDYFKKIRTSGERLMILLDNLLDLSKLEAGKEVYKMESINILQVVEDVVSERESIWKEKKLEIKTDESLASTTIRCDKRKVEQVIRNLLSNAIKFTPKDKHVAISMSSGELQLGQRSTDKKVVSALIVSVKDEGVGIPENELESVFDKFIQSSKTKTGAGGTGLGLAICKEIIIAHNGKIWAENNPEGGATFSFMLPCEKEVKMEK